MTIQNRGGIKEVSKPKGRKETWNTEKHCNGRKLF